MQGWANKENQQLSILFSPSHTPKLNNNNIFLIKNLPKFIFHEACMWESTLHLCNHLVNKLNFFPPYVKLNQYHYHHPHPILFLIQHALELLPTPTLWNQE
jgi:hypothetical protein